MTHSRKALKALLVAVVLSLATPVAIQAADNAPLTTNVADTTPLNKNLLQNPGFEQVGAGGSIPGWTVAGAVHVETFGTKAWPSPAYGKKWSGGTRYLACGRSSGLVNQTVDFSGVSSWSDPLLARLTANYGGTIGHKIRVEILITDDSGQQFSREKTKVLTITHHYLKAVTTIGVPSWAKHIQATVELMPMDGAAKCKMVADSINLFVFKP